MSKRRNRLWGFVKQWDQSTRKPKEIELYAYEKLELAKANNAAILKQKEQSQ